MKSDNKLLAYKMFLDFVLYLFCIIVIAVVSENMANRIATSIESTEKIEYSFRFDTSEECTELEESFYNP